MEDENPTKKSKVEKRTIYSLMMQEPGYQNGGTKVMFQLFKNLEGAKAAKTEWVQGWGDSYYDFGSDDEEQGEERNDKDEVDEDDKDKKGEEKNDKDEENEDDEDFTLPKYDPESLIFEGDCGGDYIYCEIEEIDLDAPDKPDGSFFFTRMNA